MVRPDCSEVWFGSLLDEKHQFEGAAEIPGFLRWEQDTLVVRSSLSPTSLRDLLALFNRYATPMAQLAQFLSSKNEPWFAAPNTYRHKKVLVVRNRTLQSSGPPAATAELNR